MSDPIENCENLCVAIIGSFGRWIRNKCTWIEVHPEHGPLVTPTYCFACFSRTIAAFEAGLDGR